VHPPGSYGLHGHGVGHHHSKIEKDWYAKHPEELAKEEDVEHLPAAVPSYREKWHMNREDLEKMVHDTRHNGECSMIISIVAGGGWHSLFLASSNQTVY